VEGEHLRTPLTAEEPQVLDRTIDITRVRKTVAGGQIPSIRAVVAVGDGRGQVGVGVGKARQHPDAIRKAQERAKKNMVLVPLRDTTIPHEVEGKVGGVSVLLKPAKRGTGIVAGVGVREVLEVAGIQDVVSKSHGAKNRLNRATATFLALKQLRSAEQVAQVRAAPAKEHSKRAPAAPPVEPTATTPEPAPTQPSVGPAPATEAAPAG